MTGVVDVAFAQAKKLARWDEWVGGSSERKRRGKMGGIVQVVFGFSATNQKKGASKSIACATMCKGCNLLFAWLEQKGRSVNEALL